MNSRIGFSIAAITESGAPSGAFSRFTDKADETRQVFIVTTNNASVDPGVQTQAEFVIGEADARGQLLIDSVASHPEQLAGPDNASGHRYPDMIPLNRWDAVVVQSSTTGFAMDIIGDHQGDHAVNTPHSSGVN